MAARIAGLVVGALDGLGHEDHVDVADVVQLVPTALAHRDHRQPAAGGRVTELGPRDGEGCVERSGGQVGELGRGVVDAEVVGQVAGGQPQQLPAVLHAQGVLGSGRIGRGHGHLAPADRRRPRASAPHASPYARAGSSPAPGRSARASGSGWRRRCSPSATLLPEHREQPHRGALVVGAPRPAAPSRSSAASARATRADKRLVGVGAPADQRAAAARPRPPAPPASRRAPSGSKNPIRARLPSRGCPGASRCRRASTLR